MSNTHYVYTTEPEFWHLISRYIEPLLLANPEMFLEVNNFFLFYSEKYRQLPTTDVADFYKDGLKMMNILQMINYK